MFLTFPGTIHHPDQRAQLSPVRYYRLSVLYLRSSFLEFPYVRPPLSIARSFSWFSKCLFSVSGTYTCMRIPPEFNFLACPGVHIV